MQAFQHKLCNDVIGAPPSVPIEECRALPVLRTQHEGARMVMSFWKPDAIELAALAQGLPVLVMIPEGAPVPPMRIEVLAP